MTYGFVAGRDKNELAVRQRLFRAFNKSEFGWVDFIVREN